MHISKEEVLQSFEGNAEAKSVLEYVEKVITKIKEMPESVTRCQDCGYRHGNYCHFWDPAGKFIYEDDYCSYGDSEVKRWE